MSEERREMNLFEFIRLIGVSIGRFFKWMLDVFLKTVRLGVRYFWVVLICAAVGFGLSFWLSQDKMVRFSGETTMFFSPDLRSQVEDGLRLYQYYLTNGMAESHLQPMTHHMASKLRKMETFYVIDSKADSIPDYVDYGKNPKALADTVNVVMPDRLVLRLKAKGLSDFSLYQESMRRFFESQPGIVLADKQRKAIEARNLELLERDLVRMDSFATYDYLEKPAQLSLEMGRTMLISERKQDIYSPYILTAMKVHANYATRVALTPDIVNFQTDFIVSRFPPLYMWIIGTCLGVLFGLLIALALKYRAEIKEYMQQK